MRGRAGAGAGAWHKVIKLIYVHNAIQRVATSRSSAPGHNFSFSSFAVSLSLYLSLSPSSAVKCNFQRCCLRTLRMLLPVHDDYNDDDDDVRYKNSCYKYELQDKHKNRKLCYVAIAISFRFA